jgi:hypothetical protein
MALSVNQQTELQALAGRSLTATDIGYANARDDADLAASLSVGLTQTVSTKIGIGGVLNALGAANGAAFLDAMNSLASTVSAIKYGIQLLDASQFDMGDPTSISVINLLVTGGTLGAETIAANTIPQTTATALLNLAIVPTSISVAQVSNILNGP